MAHPPLETFQVGWICALPIEAAAAIEMLDEKFGLLSAQASSDTNTYTLGRIGHHNVVIACLPAGQPGNTPATTVANNMTRTFSKSLRIGLMVGVGAGIPSDTNDIRLGDVVISCPQGSCGGVLQYDMGKVGLGGKFHQTGSLNSPPKPILTALALMQAAGLVDDHRLLEYLSKATERTTKTRKIFGKPSSQQDRLFRVKYEHPAASIELSCDGCSAEWEEKRESRESNDPQLHYGIIASGNTVFQHGWSREKLRLETGALCFDMEAAGLMMDFPCIVVRGICDYADSHKNDLWQGYAALTAASCAKELLGYVPQGHVSQESLVVDICNELKDGIQDIHSLLDHAYNQQERHHHQKIEFALTEQQQRCHQAFKVANYVDQKNINPSRIEGTCQWVFQSSEYMRWSHWEPNCSNLLWISADPGCGKSVLARSIVDEYEKDSDSVPVTLCYFFFKDNEEQNHLTGAICSILHQLFAHQPHLLRHAMQPFKTHGEKLQHEFEELWGILMTAMSDDEAARVVCVFDALDEAREPDQHRLIGKLEAFQQQSSTSKRNIALKFLITSRPYDQIETRFRVITESFPYLHLRGEHENDRIHHEINLVVKFQVNELAKTARLSHETEQLLEKKLLYMEHRTYLWLYLALDDIRSAFEDSLSPEDALEEIKLIPTSVNAAYGKILSRVPAAQRKTVKKMLQIIVAAQRPLTLSEMAMALGIALRPQIRTASQATIQVQNFHEKLRRLCGLFVFTHNSKIYLIHQTAREFLIREDMPSNASFLSPFSLSDANKQMALLCLQYLLMEDLTDDQAGSTSCSRNFLDYSAVNWPEHVRKVHFAAEDEGLDYLHQLYDTSRKGFFFWFSLLWRSRLLTQQSMIPETMNSMHLAAFNGHSQEMAFLISESADDINSSGGLGMTPLLWASLQGHSNIVEMLLDHGADINAHSPRFGSSLHCACLGTDDRTVQILLEHGADVEAKGGVYGSILYLACVHRLDKVTQWLLERGASVRPDGGKYGNALQVACLNVCDNIVQMLLEHGADPNMRGGYFGCALQAACSGRSKMISMVPPDRASDGKDVRVEEYSSVAEANYSRRHLRVVQMLLEYGADVNCRDGPEGDAIYLACKHGYIRIAQLLLRYGAHPESNQGQHTILRALAGASSNGHSRIVQLLLENGANVNGRDTPCGNPLAAACANGYEWIARLLIQKGADVNAPNANPLNYACSAGHIKIVKLLIEAAADVNAQTIVGTIVGKTSLYAACSKGYDRIAQLLVEAGANINAQHLINPGDNINAHNSDPENALYVASSEGHENIVQLLIAAGADINTDGSKNKNSLHVACSKGYDAIAHSLIEAGAHVNAEGDSHESCLHAAASGGYENIVDALIGAGANINAQNDQNQTALYIASSKGHFETAKLLINGGADVNFQSEGHGSVLHGACVGGHDKVVELLIDGGADVEPLNKNGSFPVINAALHGHLEVLKILVANGANIRERNQHGWMALHAAAFGGHLNVCQFLVDEEAEFDAENNDGWTALHEASYHGRVEICRFFLEHSAQPGASDHMGRTPLYLASEKGHDEIVKLLLDKHVDCTTGNNGGSVPIIIAALHGHLQVLKLLVANGANIWTKNPHGWMALHAAAFGGHLDVCQFLVEEGAQINSKNKDGWTPLHEASHHGHTNICRFLLARGAQPGLADDLERTPLHLASEAGHNELVQLLSDGLETTRTTTTLLVR